MKRFLIILVGFLFASQTFAKQGPMMATAILKSIQKNSTSPYEAYRCSSTPSMVPPDNLDSFEASITCTAKCKDGPLSQLEITKEFVPERFGLGPGDGSSQEKILWRSLGYTLTTWGNSECLDQAEKFCSTKENIQNFEFTQMSSGTWSFKGKLNCQSQEMVISPYDKGQKLAGHKTFIKEIESFFSPTLIEETNQLQTILPKDMNSEEAKKLFLFEDEKNEHCAHKINIKSCFGDCVYLEEGQKEWTETLSTNEFYGDLNFSLCADQFVKKIKNPKWSDDVNSSLCKKFAWEAIRLSDAPGTSCAAYRVEVDCSQL